MALALAAVAGVWEALFPTGVGLRAEGPEGELEAMPLAPRGRVGFRRGLKRRAHELLQSEGCRGASSARRNRLRGRWRARVVGPSGEGGGLRDKEFAPLRPKEEVAWKGLSRRRS